ncbi:MAG: PRELI-like family-domain-containing protein [Olpidium bornovanus]|uniref:PRELI-like family-domain-containing protein n=1 Tax=Olpidium bornovanus TaxID=278681 RepID=A0A8H8DJK7_9FUNG|nr:MAG: PRELI-like family-domain-containing protein [Olpidium bornovanus]
MKLFQTSHIYPHPWATITQAAFAKYKYRDTTDLTHVVAVDVLDRSVDPHTGRLRTERLITCDQSAPAFIKKLLGGSTLTYIHEVSYVDVESETHVAKSRNLTGSNLILCEENVVYTPDPQDKERTLFTQSAEITALLNFSKLSHAVEEFCVKRFRENAEKGRRALEDVVDRILKEGRELSRDLAVKTEEMLHPGSKKA